MLNVGHNKGRRTQLKTQLATVQCQFTPVDNRRLADLCGPQNEHLNQIEAYFDVKIRHRSNTFDIIGQTSSIAAAKEILQRLYAETTKKSDLTPAKVFLFLKEARIVNPNQHEIKPISKIKVHTEKHNIKPRGKNQETYINHIRDYDMVFGIGPAGTGKTYLAVACGIEALEREEVQRIIFVRPAVEAGENLGFLPGDLEEKILPYLRPLYDALYEMLGFDRVAKLIEQNIIEVAPLAYMRGRTLNDAFIILDEAQNTTPEQMKMFLTRIGFGSTAVITGDITQIDLARGARSGLSDAIQVLKNIKNISFNYFDAKDAVRHPLVQSVIEAYAEHEEKK